LLVLVNIATEIALTTIAAATRHLLVLVTSSGHHNILMYCSSTLNRFYPGSLMLPLWFTFFFEPLLIPEGNLWYLHL
jgi:hypothetical protein